MADRISSFAQTSTLINNNLRVQANYAEKQVQISTGVISNTFQGISDDTNEILSLESDYNRLMNQSANAQQALDRNETAFSAIGNIIEVGQSILTSINGVISSTGSSTAQIQEAVANVLNLTAGALNSQVGGRYIFSGSATDTAPVNINDPAWGGATLIPPVAPATDPTLPPANTSYYQGNSDDLSVEASNALVVNYGIQANEESLEKVMRAYDLILTTPDDQDTLELAYDLLLEGLDEVAELQAIIAQDSRIISQAIDANLDEMNLIDNLLSDLKDIDLAEVTTRIAELQAQLEASYSITTNLLRLNLADFI